MVLRKMFWAASAMFIQHLRAVSGDKSLFRQWHQKFNLGGSVAVLDRERSHTQNKSTGRKTRVNCEEVQRAGHLRLPSKEEEVREASEKVLKANRFAILAMESEDVFTRQA